MKLPLYWIDAFTDRVFAGNPAAVVPLTDWPDDALLQKIAFENGLSETAFFVRTDDARFRLRWFTPAVEVDLCGHATFASAHVLFRELGQNGDLVTFDSRSGPLHVRRRDGEQLELDLPAQPVGPVDAAPALIDALGRKPDQVLGDDRRRLCVYSHSHDVSTLQPDHAKLAALHPGRIIVTAPGEDCDFVSRYFAPDAGIREDPVTGVAHCTLVPYWAQRLGKTALHARQVSARGGELWCRLDSPDSTATHPTEAIGAGPRVRISGRGKLYLRGEIFV